MQLEKWLEDRTRDAPALLVARAKEFVAEIQPSRDAGEHLALAGAHALSAAIDSGDSRAAALDLLAGDALITLALLRYAEFDPTALGQRAKSLRSMILDQEPT